MLFFKNFMFGLLIGIGFIIPGVSGGALAVILGIYDKIFSAIKNWKQKENLLFLISLGFGCMVGAIAFGNVLLFLFNKREVPTKFIFMGLIIGGIPSLIKEIKKQPEGSLRLLPFIVALTISVFLYILENSNASLNVGLDLLDGNIPIFGLFLSGILYAIGKIIPGISGAALLILVGMYEYLLTIIANPLLINIDIMLSLLPFLLGAFLGIIMLYKLMNYLFSKHYMTTYSAIIGFVLGSLLYLYPGLSLDISGIICLVLLISSSIFAYMISK